MGWWKVEGAYIAFLQVHHVDLDAIVAIGKSAATSVSWDQTPCRWRAIPRSRVLASRLLPGSTNLRPSRSILLHGDQHPIDMVGVIPGARDAARKCKFFLRCLTLAKRVVDRRTLNLTIAFGRRNGLVGGLGGSTTGVDIVLGLCGFPFGGRALAFLGSDRLLALSLSVWLSVVGAYLDISGILLLWRGTLLGRSDGFSGVSIGVGVKVGSSSSFLHWRALLGWLSGVIIGCGSSTTLLWCLWDSFGVLQDGMLVILVCLGDQLGNVESRKMLIENVRWKA